MIFATAAEYNPFHKGHEYHIEQMKKLGATGIIAVMSPDFVQRAEPAVFNKFDRAYCAVKGGVDLVLELPTPYAVGSAERFARGCVEIAEKTGIVDRFCFGSESGDLKALKTLSEVIKADGFSDALKRRLKEGKSYPTARAEAMKEYGYEAPKSPNDILAVEYLKALSDLSSEMEPVTVKRVGDYHGSEEGFASASKIRELFYGGKTAEKDLPPYVSEFYGELKEKGLAPAEPRFLERSVIAYLRTADKEELKACYGITEGLENRLVTAAAKAENIDDLYEKIKTKRYTLSAVRRAVLCAFLKIERKAPEISLLRVLAFNERGTELMKEIKEKSSLPLVTVFNGEEKDEKIAAYRQTERRASDIFSTATPKIAPGYEDYTRKITVIK